MSAHVLHICCNLAGSTVFSQLFEALRDAGLAQTVFVPEKRAQNMNRNVPRGVPTHYARTVRTSDMLFFPMKARRTVPVIRQTVDCAGVTLIHAHTLFTDGSIARRLSAQTGIPYMVTLRYSDIEAIWKYEPHLRPMARRILRGAQAIVFLSDVSREKVLRGWFRAGEGAALRSRTAVIPNGIDPAWLDGHARRTPGDPVRVGFAGLFNDRKRPLDALSAVRAAQAAGDRRYVLHACGSGPLEAKLRAAMQPEDRFAGRVQGMEAMKAFYADCDVLLVPSSAETFGMVYLEAMSQGVPVLYTRGQGFDGQFPEGEVGYSVVCGDVAQQAKRLGDVLQDYEARSARCVARAAAYAWPEIAKRWMALYQAAPDAR